MRIDLMEHRDIIRGAAEVEETPEGVRPTRMTADAVDICRQSGAAISQAEFTAGVRIAFVTDSSMLEMRLVSVQGASSSDYQVDILLNRSECHTFSPEDPEDEFEFSLDLPEEEDGENEVEIWLPISAAVEIRELSIADGALFRPIYCSDERMLLLGGASTMGRAASSPLRSYAALLAAQLNIDYINWALGGMKLSSALAGCAMALEWQRCVVFCDSENYVADMGADESAEELARLLDHLTGRPGIALTLVTPLWFEPCEGKPNAAGSTLADFRAAYVRSASSFPGVKVIDGGGLLPSDPDFFDSSRRFPSDEGMALIAEKLAARLG